MGRTLSIALVAGLATAASGQVGGQVPNEFFPYANVERAQWLVLDFPNLRGTSMGSSAKFSPQLYNPAHPNSDFDGDGIRNGMDSDADGDLILNDQDHIFWSQPSTNPNWIGALPSWDADWINANQDCAQPPACPYPTGPVYSMCADTDGDGQGNAFFGMGPDCSGFPGGGVDYDDDNDGVRDFYDQDHPMFNPLASMDTVNNQGNDWDNDGLLDQEDPDIDGDGLGNQSDNNDRKYQPHVLATLEDWDGDGIPNSCDPDPVERWQVVGGWDPLGDADGDGWPNNCDDDPCVPEAPPDPMGDMDGDGWPNGCDPEPCNFSVPALPWGPNGDSDGDGWPNGCDPEPCNAEQPGPMDPDGDEDGDGWPNGCDPEPCNSATPAEPPADPDDPCGDGDDPPGPGGGGDVPDPPDDPDRPDDPPPFDRPPTDPPDDDPDPPPPPPPEPPPPPVIPPPPSDDACCEAICDRLDAIIAQSYQGNLTLTQIQGALERFVGNSDGTGMWQQFYERMISDDDSMRNRMDNGLWTIADLLNQIQTDTDYIADLLEGGDDDGSGGYTLPDAPDDLTPPGELGGWYTDQAANFGEFGLKDENLLPDLSSYADPEAPPVWEFSIPWPTIGGVSREPLAFSVDWAFYAPVRLIVHGMLILLATLNGVRIVWEEFRRFG